MWQAAWGTVISQQKIHKASQGLGSVLSKNTCVYLCLCSFLQVCTVVVCELGEGYSALTGHLLNPERQNGIRSFAEMSLVAPSTLRKMPKLLPQPPQVQPMFPFLVSWRRVGS